MSASVRVIAGLNDTMRTSALVGGCVCAPAGAVGAFPPGGEDLSQPANANASRNNNTQLFAKILEYINS
jgi:hypothetical protein